MEEFRRPSVYVKLRYTCGVDGERPGILSGKARLVAAMAAMVAAVAGSLEYGPLFAVFPSVQFIGALIQPVAPRPGKSFLSLGAFIQTVCAAGFLAPALGSIRTLMIYHDRDLVLAFGGALLSVCLVTWSDVVLILEFRRLRREVPSEPSKWSMLDSLLVFVAICLSVTEIPLYPGALRTGRWDILATYLAFASLALWLDLAVAKRVVQLVRASSGRPQT